MIIGRAKRMYQRAMKFYEEEISEDFSGGEWIVIFGPQGYQLVYKKDEFPMGRISGVSLLVIMKPVAAGSNQAKALKSINLPLIESEISLLEQGINVLLYAPKAKKFFLPQGKDEVREVQQAFMRHTGLRLNFD